MREPAVENLGEAQEHNWIVGEMRIHGYTAGIDGPPVVLLHGGGIDSAWLSWRCLISPLSLSHRVIAFDWPGYGESDPGRPFHHTLEASITLIGDLMDALGLASSSLVGISMGGAAALGYALQQPRRVERLVLADPYGIQRKVAFHFLSYLFIMLPWVTELTYAYLRRSRWAIRASLKFILSNPLMPDDTLVEEVYQAVQKSGAGKSFNDLQRDELTPWGLKTVYLDRVAEIRMPVLLVHGEKDALVPVACAREAKRLNSNLQLEVLPDCGHWPQRDWPERFNAAVMEFLA